MTGYQFPQDREKFLAVVHNLDNIQPPPSNALRLLQMCKDPQACTSEIISLIESEPAISARVLAVSNSPLYGYTRQIGSISHAVVILGIRNITQLAISFGAAGIFMDNESCQQIRKGLYRHSLGVALLSRALAEHIDEIDGDEAFVAGILHDIGKVTLLQLIPDRYETILTEHQADVLQSVEQDDLGISHAAIGGICASRWGLPVPIQKAIEHHHDLESDSGKISLASVVRAADWLSHREGIGSDPKEDFQEFPYDDYSILSGFGDEVIQWVIDEAQEQLQVLDQAV